MRYAFRGAACCLILALLIACRADHPDTIAVTPIASKSAASCADLDANWGRDWSAVVETLNQLIEAKQTCGAESLASKQYAAHFNYGVALEQTAQREAAIGQYRAALALDAQRAEALDALVRLKALPTPTPAACLATPIPQSVPSSNETPDRSKYVTTQGNHLLLDQQPFKIKGVNYYPRFAPWHQFLVEAKQEDIIAELSLIQLAGFNTIRIFLRYEPLFTCAPENAVPVDAVFAKVDALLDLARQHHLKVIVTLNDLPDLYYRALYTDWAHYDAQTIYIVRRYRNDPNILAWDLRNEGDLDYGASSNSKAQFSQDEVIQWLAHVSRLVRDNDPYHLITAGWWGDPTATAPYVGFLSFHHWSTPEILQTRITQYQQTNQKPMLLEEVGYHSWAAAPQDSRDLQSQAGILERVIDTVEQSKISGWMIWTAFDFAPQNDQPATYEHFFGLWQVDLTPKPALKALPLP